MGEDFCLRESLRQHFMVGDVVKVCVGEPKLGDLPAALFDLFDQRGGGIVGGVDQDGLAGGFIGDEIAVGGGQPASVGQYLHNGHRIAQ